MSQKGHWRPLALLLGGTRAPPPFPMLPHAFPSCTMVAKGVEIASTAASAGSIGTGSRNLLSNSITLGAHEPPKPAWDNPNAREAGSRSAHYYGAYASVGFLQRNQPPSTTFAGRCSAAKSWWHGASNRSNFHRQAPLWCHRSRRRATHSRMQTVSLARRLNRRRTANACALTRSLQSLAVVLGLEVGGRFSREAASFLRELAKPRARESPARLPGAQQTKQTSLRSWALPGWHACGLRGHQFQQIVRAVE